jgi:hypothetical protein
MLSLIILFLSSIVRAIQPNYAFRNPLTNPLPNSFTNPSTNSLPNPKLSLFFCHQMIPGSSAQIKTFEFRNPKTNTRGVACVIAVDAQSAYFYTEEEGSSSNRIGGLGFAKRTNDGVFTGNLWKFAKADEGRSSTAAPFTVDTGSSGNFWTLQVSGKSVIWQPRTDQGVANWQMAADLLPRTCPAQMHQLAIIDPIPGNNRIPDRKGVVCVNAAREGLADFFAVGWRRVEGSGQLRKFVNFGRMHRSPKSSRSFDGKLINFYFLTAADQPDDRDQVRLDLVFKAIPSQQGHSLLLLGDLKEKWISPGFDAVSVNNEIYII